MLKEFWNNVKYFFKNLGSVVKTIFNPGASDSFEEERERKNVLRNQNSLNQQPYQEGSYNPDDPSRLYNYYNQLGPGGVESLANKYSEAGITGQQAALNEMSLDNQRRQYAFQVQGMQEAGLNPALMYESGATQGPNAPAPTQGASMSELIQLLLLDKQSKYLQAQTDNVNADTDKKKAETENMKLVNQYYPDLTQTQIDKTLRDMGLTDAQIENVYADTNSKNLDVELKRIDKVIKQAQADESSAFYKATRELEEAKTRTQNAETDKLVAEKEKLVVEKAMEMIEKEYMSHTNTKMGSASIVAIAAALGTLFSNFSLDFDIDDVKNPFDVEAIKKSFRESIQNALDWINKPKNAPWVK